MDKMEDAGMFNILIVGGQLISGPLVLSVHHEVGAFMTGGIASGLKGLGAGHVLHTEMVGFDFIALNKSVRNAGQYKTRK